MEVCERILRIRTLSGISCGSLADLAGFTLDEMRKIENGKHKITPDLLQKIATALDVSLAVFTDNISDMRLKTVGDVLLLIFDLADIGVLKLENDKIIFNTAMSGLFKLQIGSTVSHSSFALVANNEMAKYMLSLYSTLKNKLEVLQLSKNPPKAEIEDLEESIYTLKLKSATIKEEL